MVKSHHLALLFLIGTITTPVIHSADFVEVRDFLRDNDERLIRPQPTKVTFDRQNSDACKNGLIDALTALSARQAFPMNQRIAAANVVSLCTHDRPAIKTQMANFGKGGHAALVGMLGSMIKQSTKENTLLAAAAGEAIWSAAWRSPANHQLFMESGALPALTDVLILPCEGRNICQYAQMWAAAALGVMAAPVCRTPTGRCEFEYDYEENRPALSDSTPFDFMPGPVRNWIMARPPLFEKILAMTCRGPVNKPHVEDVYPWPSRAEIAPDEDEGDNEKDEGDNEEEEGEFYDGVDREFPTIATWAAVDVLQGLAIDPHTHSGIGKAFNCLCDLNRSPDTMEQSRAEEVLDLLGKLEDGCPLFYPPDCESMRGWKDSLGEDCASYERNNWCIEYGEHLRDNNGINAQQACCACGGGTRGSSNA